MNRRRLLALFVALPFVGKLKALAPARVIHPGVTILKHQGMLQMLSVNAVTGEYKWTDIGPVTAELTASARAR